MRKEGFVILLRRGRSATDIADRSTERILVLQLLAIAVLQVMVARR